MSKFLAATIASGSNVQANLVTGATPTTLGVAVGGVNAYLAASPSTNRLVKLGPALFLATGTGLYRSVNNGESWTLVSTYTIANSISIHGPFEVTSSSGETIYALVYMETLSALIRFLTSTDGITWTDTSTAFANTSGSIGFGTVVRGRLYCRYSGVPGQGIVSFDPFSLSFDVVSDTPSVASYLVNWSDTLYFIAPNGSNHVVLKSLIGTTITTHVTLTTNTFAGSAQTLAFPDPSTENLIVVTETSGGWQAFSVTDSYVVTEVTSTMLTGTPLASYAAAIGMGVVINQIDSPGAVPVISLYYSSANTTGSILYQYNYNGTGSLLGDGSGNPNDSGMTVNYAIPNGNVTGIFNFEPPAETASETSGSATGNISSLTSINGGIVAEFEITIPRQDLLTTIGGSPATYNLATTPIPTTPVAPRSVSIVGTISTATQTAVDDGSGNFPVSTLLPSGGTIDYATGIMTGITASLDANSEVRAYWSGGSGAVQFFMADNPDNYPASAADQAQLSNPSAGSISGGDTNINVPANNSTNSVELDVGAANSGDIFNIQMLVTPNP